MSTSYDRLRNTQTPHWCCLTFPMLQHGDLHPHSLTEGRFSLNPDLTHVSPSGPGCQPLSHTRPVLHINSHPLKCTMEVCDTKRVPRYLPPTRLVEAFGRTTATSACAMVTKRQAYTHPLHWASPARLLPPVLPHLLAPAALISQITKHG